MPWALHTSSSVGNSSGWFWNLRVIPLWFWEEVNTRFICSPVILNPSEHFLQMVSLSQVKFKCGIIFTSSRCAVKGNHAGWRDALHTYQAGRSLTPSVEGSFRSWWAARAAARSPRAVYCRGSQTGKHWPRGNAGSLGAGTNLPTQERGNLPVLQGVLTL